MWGIPLQWKLSNTYQTLTKETEQDTHKMASIPCSPAVQVRIVDVRIFYHEGSTPKSQHNPPQNTMSMQQGTRKHKPQVHREVSNTPKEPKQPHTIKRTKSEAQHRVLVTKS